MKRKSTKLLVLTIALASFFSSNIAVMAKTTNRKDHVQPVSKAVKYSKQAEKEIRIITLRLDKIHISLKVVENKVDTYLNSTTSSAIQVTTSSSITEDSTTGSTLDETTKNGSTTVDSNIEDLTSDFQNEYDEEDSGRNNSFLGKLNAIDNRLNTVERQINRIKDSGNPKIDEFKVRLEKLRQEVKIYKEKVASVEKQNVEIIKARTDKKQMDEQKINQEKKAWKVQFTKDLKAETVVPRNIMILDSSNNLVDANISYDKNTRSVVIETKDGFINGQSYIILIGGEVQSSDGIKLSTPVEKKFIVN